MCRYPRHDARTYETGEGADDETLADQVRAITAQLAGVAELEEENDRCADRAAGGVHR